MIKLHLLIGQMRHVFGIRQNVYFAIVSITLLAVFLRNMPTDSSSWASWMQAFGSIAAIFGAIWIARTDERKREIESLAVAEITAVEVLGRLGPIHGCIGSCADAIAKSDVPTEEFRLRHRDLGELSLPTAEDIRRLVPIEGSVAIDLAQIFTEISNARVVLERAGRHEMNLERRALFAENIQKIVKDLPNQIEKSRQALIKFLRYRGHIVNEDVPVGSSIVTDD